TGTTCCRLLSTLFPYTTLFRSHLKARTPEWASQICGVPVAEIEAFAKLVGETKRTFFRLGYGFTRSRNGATQMHAASCIPAVTRSEEHTSELQSHLNLVCRLLL